MNEWRGKCLLYNQHHPFFYSSTTPFLQLNWGNGYHHILPSFNSCKCGVITKGKVWGSLSSASNPLDFKISEPWERIWPKEALPVLLYPGFISGSFISSTQSLGNSSMPSIGHTGIIHGGLKDRVRIHPLVIITGGHIWAQFKEAFSSSWTCPKTDEADLQRGKLLSLGFGQRLEGHLSTLVLSDTQLAFKVFYSIQDTMIVAF